MHNFDAISQKISGGGPPDPHLREGVTPSPTLPLSALRASVNASLFTCAPPPPPGSGGSGSAPERSYMHVSVSIPNASMNMQKNLKINIFENVENTEDGVGASQKC